MSKYPNGQVLAIQYNLWISGTLIGFHKKQYIQSITVNETVEGADTATVVINDPEMLFLEDDIFVEENTIKIMMGWDTSTYRVTFDGYISAVDIDFPSDGVPVVTISCIDNTHKMNREKKDKTFKDMTSADVVKKICGEYGFGCVVESDYNFTKQETITQSDQTDIDFITKLANDEVYPFTARLVGNTFYYVKKGKLQTPSMTLTYRTYPHEIISFKPKINKETRQTNIESTSMNTSDKSTSQTDIEGNTGQGSADAGSDSDTSENDANTASGGTKKYDPTTKSWN